MKYPMIEIGPQTRISLNFAIKLASGEVVDSNFDRPPVQFVVGDGNLLPGFERALFGLRAGQRAELRIDADQGFGPHREENVQVFDRDQFDANPELGMVLNFADAARGEVPGVVIAVANARVEVDFNHPLAGRELLFEVQIHDVQPEVSY